MMQYGRQAAPERRPGIQAIARAGTVLRALEARPEGMGLAELAQAVALPKSTVHRLVRALAAEELVAVDSAGRIALGGAIARMAAAARDRFAELVRPALVELRDELEETVDLAVLDGDSARFVDQLAVPHRLRAVSAVGEAFPLYCTANGKALLATLEEDRALALLPARLERLTPATITSRARVAKQLAEVRRTGVAFDREEHTEGLCAVGAAVVGPGGLAGAISVPVPAARFRRGERRYAEAVAGAARRAGALLGA
jgi:DNA-binding IclR family transcriptional regulator